MRLYTRTLGFKEVYREVVYDQGVEAVGLEAGGSVRRAASCRSTKTSAIARYRGDAATKLHHTAYRVADIEAKLAELKAARRRADRRARRGAARTEA